MTEMLETIKEWPIALGWITLYCIVFLRAGATYGLGRAVAAGFVRNKRSTENTSKAISLINKWGPLAIAVSFLTVGVQSVINFSAGLITMPVRRYLLGLIPGAALWATMWLTAGLGAIMAMIAGPMWLNVTVIVAIVAIVFGIRHWRKSNVTKAQV